MLAFPDLQRPLILNTDASDLGLSARLFHEWEHSEQVVAYFICSLSQPERNYCVTRESCWLLSWDFATSEATYTEDLVFGPLPEPEMRGEPGLVYYCTLREWLRGVQQLTRQALTVG